MSETLRLPDDCSGQCQNCGHHNQEKRERAVPEKAEEQGYKGEFEKAFERTKTTKGITLDDLRRAHKDDVRYFHGRIKELEKRREVLALWVGELQIKLAEALKQVPKTVKAFRPQCLRTDNYGVLVLRDDNCSACGAAIQSTANFCSGCGAKFDWSEGGEA